MVATFVLAIIASLLFYCGGWWALFAMPVVAALIRGRGGKARIVHNPVWVYPTPFLPARLLVLVLTIASVGVALVIAYKLYYEPMRHLASASPY